MKKKEADMYRDLGIVESELVFEGNDFVRDLAHLPEILERWGDYKNTSPSIMPISKVTEVLDKKNTGKAKVVEVSEEDDDEDGEDGKKKDRKATSEEILNVSPKMKRLLFKHDPKICEGQAVSEELKEIKTELTSKLLVTLFNIIFRM